MDSTGIYLSASLVVALTAGIPLLCPVSDLVRRMRECKGNWFVGMTLSHPWVGDLLPASADRQVLHQAQKPRKSLDQCPNKRHSFVDVLFRNGHSCFVFGY